VENEEINYIYYAVDEFIDETMERMKVPYEYRFKVLESAVSFLKPEYVPLKSGKLYAKINLLQQQFYTDIMSALVSACVKVRSEKSGI